MAAYAALVSVMHIIHDIQRHHSPPISLDKQLQSLTQVVTSLQGFLESYNAPAADGDEADPLEMRIADAAYAAEDVIESHIVDNIHLQNQQTSSLASKISGFFNCFGAPKKPDNVDDQENKCINFYEDLQRVIDEMDLVAFASEDVRLQFEGFHGYSVGVIDYGTGKRGTALMYPEYSNIFWPPPAWLIRS